MTDDTIDPPVEPTLLEQFTKAISEDPQFQEASTGKGSVVVGMKKQETAREFAPAINCNRSEMETGAGLRRDHRHPRRARSAHLIAALSLFVTSE
jgi:hypothetical protein